MKLAYFSPLNPQPSGISDYSEELLPQLANYAQLDLFVDGFSPSNPEVIKNYRVVDYQREPSALERLPEYDAVIYHVGNDHRYHSGIYRTMQQHAGIAVFHDFALQDFFLGLAREAELMNIYLDELEACHGKRERARAEIFLRRGSEPPQAASPLEFPINCRLANSAEGIIVHSEWSRKHLAPVAPAVPITRINHHITARAAATPTTPRVRGKSHAVRISSFGLITREKGIERALRILATLSNECDFHYTLVGSANNYPELSEIIRRFGLSNHVTITGHVSLEEFERRIAETDIAINLRERPVGATSGSLCRIMAAGVPAIVSNVGAFAELPGDAVIKIDHDQYGDELLQAYLRKLIEDDPLRERIGQNARRHVLAEHDIETSAASYISFIHEVIARRPRRQFLNNVSDELSLLGIGAKDDTLLRAVASEVAVLAPAGFYSSSSRLQKNAANESAKVAAAKPSLNDNGHHAAAQAMTASPTSDSQGRTPKVEGIDYKRAAIDYLGKLSEERQHHLRTKPFYNLANKPAKYQGEGMDADMHRHFCDFANIAVGLALPPGARILDVGCGSGWLSEYFARLGYDVKGIDISPALIAMSRERVARVPYGVDHESPLRCTFEVHDIELAPLNEKFDAIICYDSLHHLEDELSVLRHLARMLDVGGLLFILEGQKPSVGSTTEDELRDVMREFGTLESPFSDEYLRLLLDQQGLAIIGDYVSINGLFEREMLEEDSRGQSLPLRTLPTDYHYLTCMKVAEGKPAMSVPDSRNPGVLRAQFTLLAPASKHVQCGTKLELPITIRNTGDTLWLTGQTVRAGVIMPGVRVLNWQGEVVNELHGHPMLPRAVAPGQSVALNLEFAAPTKPGRYTVKIDLVDQHVSWFEERGSQPLVFSFDVENKR